MPEEYATRHELNGFGERINRLHEKVAGHDEAIKTSKQDRRDLWDAVGTLRSEDSRIERLVNQIAIKVAGIATVATLAQAFIVWYFTKSHP